MKKIFLLLFAIFIFSLSACNLKFDRDIKNGELKMIAVIQNIDEKIEVEVINNEVLFGEYWINTGEQTQYYNHNGEEITREELNVGDIIEIDFTGQVMMSFPPQIVALKITIKE